MQIIHKNTKNEYNIVLSKVTGEESLLCPLCSHTRKKATDKCFSWNHEIKAGKCNHCNESFYIKREFIKEKTYSKPEEKTTTIDEKAVLWFKEKRHISKETLEKMYVCSGLEFMPQTKKDENCIQFKYFQNSELINIKFRNAKKDFKLSKDAELIFYNYNALIYNNSKEIIITEGEIDTLSFIEVGLNDVISVPNGATKGNCNMPYLDSSIDLFDNLERVYIATDNDEAGINLRNELIRRIGHDKCYIVDFKEQKDANEYLIVNGKDKLINLKKAAKEVQIEGIVKLENIEDEVDDLWLNGLQGGEKINHDNLDELITWQTKRLAIFTGIPGHGKSETVDEICTRLNIIHGWKVGYFSPENFPMQLHVAKIMEKLTGKIYSHEFLRPEDQLEAKAYINENYYFIKPEDENYSLTQILSKAKWLIKKFGIKIFVIDAWNKLEHLLEKGDTETNYVSKTLDKIIMFEQTYDILFIIVAHPTKQQKKDGVYEIPNLYSINGSSNFFNKCDYGLCTYRVFGDKEHIQIHVQKVKFKHLGKQGLANFKYNTVNGRFMPITSIEMPICQQDNDNYIKLNGIRRS